MFKQLRRQKRGNNNSNNPAEEDDDDNAEPMRGRGTSSNSNSTTKGGGGHSSSRGGSRFDNRQSQPYTKRPSSSSSSSSRQRSSSLGKQLPKSKQHNRNKKQSSSVSWVSAGGRTMETETDVTETWTADYTPRNSTSNSEPSLVSSSSDCNDDDNGSNNLPSGAAAAEYNSDHHESKSSIGLGESGIISTTGTTTLDSYSEESGIIFSSDQSNSNLFTDHTKNKNKNAAVNIIRGGGKKKKKPSTSADDDDGGGDHRDQRTVTSRRSTSNNSRVSSTRITGNLVGEGMQQQQQQQQQQQRQKRSNSNPSRNSGITTNTNSSHGGGRSLASDNNSAGRHTTTNGGEENQEEVRLKPPSMKGMPSLRKLSKKNKNKQGRGGHKRSQSTGDFVDSFGSSNVSSFFGQSSPTVATSATGSGGASACYSEGNKSGYESEASETEVAAMQQLAYLVVSLRADLKMANDAREALLQQVKLDNNSSAASSTDNNNNAKEMAQQLKQENIDLQADLDAFIAEQDDLKLEISELRDEKSSLNDMISRLKKDANPNSASAASFGGSSTRSLHSGSGNKVKSIDDLQERIQDLTDENHKLEKEIQLLVGEKSQLVSTRNDRADEIDALQKSLKEIESRHANELINEKENKDSVEALQSKITSLEESYDIVEKESKASKMTIAVMEDEIAEKSNELITIREDHTKALDCESKKMTLLRNRLNQVEKQKGEVQDLNTNLENTKSSLEDQLEELHEECAASLKVMETLKADNVRVSNELKVKSSTDGAIAPKATTSGDDSHVNDLKKKIVTLEETKNILEEELDDMDAELKNNSAVVTAMKEQLQAQQEKDDKISDLENQLRVQQEERDSKDGETTVSLSSEQKGEVKYLKERIATLVADNEALQAQLNELEKLKDGGAKTTDQNQVSLDTIANLQKMVTSLEGTNTELEEEMNEATEAVSLLEDELDRKEVEMKEEVTKLTLLQEDFSQSKKEMSSLAKQNEALLSTNDDLNTQVKFITIEKKVACEEVETIKAMKNIADEDQEEALLNRQEQKQEVDLLEERLEELRSKNRDEISALEQQVFSFEESKRKLVEELDESSDAITVLREALTEMEEDKLEKDRQIKELKLSLGEKESTQKAHDVNVDTIATLQKMITSLEASKVDLEEELNASSAELHDLKDKLQKKNTLAEVTELENKLAEASRENKSLTKRITELSEANDKMKVEVKELGESLASVTATKSESGGEAVTDPNLGSCDTLLSELKNQIKQIVLSRDAALHEVEVLREEASVVSGLPPTSSVEVIPAASVAPNIEKTNKKTAAPSDPPQNGSAKTEEPKADCDKTLKTAAEKSVANSSAPSNASSRGSSLLEAAKKLCDQLDEKKSKQGSEKKSTESDGSSPKPTKANSKPKAAAPKEEEDDIKDVADQDDDVTSAKEIKEVDKTPADVKEKSSEEDKNRKSSSGKPKLDIDQLTSIYFEKCGMSVSRFSDLSSDSSSFRRRSVKAPSGTVTKKVKICRNGVFMGTYEGDLNPEGQRHGFGVLLCDNGNSYEGEWKKDKRDGLGIARYSSGDVYDGQWQRGKRQGHGVMYIEAGDTYIGSWNNGLKHGAGTYHWADGEVDVSWYQEDRRVGEGVRWNASRSKAFQLIRGTKKEELSLDQAYITAEKLGLNLEKFDAAV